MSSSFNGQPIKVAVAKESPDVRVGITLRQDADEDILINTISSDSLFANTRLKPGMEVLLINNTECLSLSHAMKLLKEAEDVVTIEACAIQKETMKSERPTPSAPYRPDPDGDVEAQYDDNNDPSLIVVSSNEVIDVDGHASGVATIPVASAQVLANTGNSTGTVLATPVDNSINNTMTGGAIVKQDVVNMDGSITVTATKPSPDAKTGVTLVRRPGAAGVVVTGIKTFSIFTGTNLRVGMKILSVNGMDVTNESSQHVATLLKSIVGDVTIVATDLYNNGTTTTTPTASATAAESITHMVTVVVMKPAQDAKVGITVYDKQVGWSTRKIPTISKLNPNGPAGSSALQPGMRMLSINGISCRNRDDTVAMLRMAPAGQMTIVAGPLRFVAATVTKETPSTKVGLAMARRVGDSNLYISKLPPTGLFANRTDLQMGMQVQQINGIDVQHMETQQVLGIIQAAEGTVTVIAKDVSPDTPKTEATTVPVPPGAPAGGHWGLGNVFGATNALWYCILCSLCGIFGLCMFCCKLDKEPMYRAPNGRIYDAKGTYVGSESVVHFQYNPPGVQGPQQLPKSEVEQTCGPNYVKNLIGLGTCIWFLWFILTLVFRVGSDDDDCKYQYCYEYDYYSGRYENKYVFRCGGC